MSWHCALNRLKHSKSDSWIRAWTVNALFSFLQRHRQVDAVYEKYSKHKVASTHNRMMWNFVFVTAVSVATVPFVTSRPRSLSAFICKQWIPGQNNWQIRQNLEKHVFEQHQYKEKVQEEHKKFIPCQVVAPNGLQNSTVQWSHHGLNLDLSWRLGLGLPPQVSGIKCFWIIHIKNINHQSIE